MGTREATRPAVPGTHGMVASAHPLASMAGLRMLMQGGNAVDAAVAVASTLNVVEPYMSGMGGDGSMLIYVVGATEPTVLDYYGLTPWAAALKGTTADDLKMGPKASLVPGNLGGWLEALRQHGTLKPREVLAPAIGYAENGFPVTHKNAEFIEGARERLQLTPEGAALFLPGGKPPRPGSLLVQKELAQTYRKVADQGGEVFYKGEISKAIVRQMRALGGWMTEEDMAGFTPMWTQPIRTTYRGYELVSVPAPFGGAQVLETLNILEGFDLRAMGHNTVESLHTLIEAVKLACADRIAYLGLEKPPTKGWISKAYADAQRKRIDPRRAGVSGGERFSADHLPNEIAPGSPADYERENTTHFAVADGQGNVVTCTQSLGSPFGSGVYVPGTGIFLNNFLMWSDLDPASPSILRAGRKCESRMAPAQIYRDGRFRFSIGTPGSYGIPQTTSQMICNLLDFEMDIQAAIEAPRFRGYRGTLVEMESRVPAEVREGLKARGHEVRAIDDYSWSVGGGHGIARDPESGALTGGADPRRDGYAVGW